MNWQVILEPIIQQAGVILISYYGKVLTCQAKKNHGFVTEADRASENYLIDQLAKILPKASFFAEESGRSGNNDYCWVIDPLDGTTNFSHKLPYFCISVALTYKGKPQVGILYQPLTNELFFAERGKGAFLNGEKIKISLPKYFNNSLVAMGLPYQSLKRKQLLHVAERIAQQAYGVRHFGAIALDLAYVACGRIDGAFFACLDWWDVAAGMLLIEQAGGVVTDFFGQPISEDYTSCIAGSKMVHYHMLAALKG